MVKKKKRSTANERTARDLEKQRKKDRARAKADREARKARKAAEPAGPGADVDAGANGGAPGVAGSGKGRRAGAGSVDPHDVQPRGGKALKDPSRADLALGVAMQMNDILRTAGVPKPRFTAEHIAALASGVAFSPALQLAWHDLGQAITASELAQARE